MKGPSTVKGVQKLVGSINFLRQFIPDYSRMAEPITRLLSSKSKEIVWGSEQKETWETILESLEKRLTISQIQEEGELILRTDASTFGIGGVLLQKQEDREVLINLFSRKFTKTEQRWTTIEQEAFGIVYGVISNSYYLLGKRFTVETDHRNLTFIYKSEVPKLLRWRLKLAQFEFDIHHIPGKVNLTADVLSRISQVQESSFVKSIQHSDDMNEITEHEPSRKDDSPKIIDLIKKGP
ncbi:hypothetical protein ADUPG1_004884 [Aduncisulcus paluster]|uniref:Reverse transcriptase RNase H-like domain-containing protein n=1 Tax=Aduncisulcus paluster TaxID=2918883 RepID=A0ABQ5KAA7_9EUKA|nr:hypothetical protein ADUPG1_004884 [Aduncisulcus paluster]